MSRGCMHCGEPTPPDSVICSTCERMHWDNDDPGVVPNQWLDDEPTEDGQ